MTNNEITERLMAIRQVHPHTPAQNLVRQILEFPLHVLDPKIIGYAGELRESGVSFEALRSRIRRLDQGIVPRGYDRANGGKERYCGWITWQPKWSEVFVFDDRDDLDEFVREMAKAGHRVEVPGKNVLLRRILDERPDIIHRFESEE